MTDVIEPPMLSDITEGLYEKPQDPATLTKDILPPANFDMRVVCVRGVSDKASAPVVRIPARVIPYLGTYADLIENGFGQQEDEADTPLDVDATKENMEDIIKYIEHYIDNRDDYPSEKDREKHPITEWDAAFITNDLKRIVPLMNVAHFLGARPFYKVLVKTMAQLWKNKKWEEIVEMFEKECPPYHPDAS